MQTINSEKFSTRWISRDLLESCAVALPMTFALKPGALIEIAFPDGRVGNLVVTEQRDPDRLQARWNCEKSKYDGRTFDLEWHTHSDMVPLGQPITVPVLMTLVEAER